MGDVRETPSNLLYFGFNQDYGCFSCGLNNGFRLYNCEPFRETFRREFPEGGIGIVEMLFRCNILVLVGGGVPPKFVPNKVMIWDDHQVRCIGELTFRSQVRAVKVRRDRIVMALEHKVLVYNFSDLRLVHSIETQSNPLGLIALSAAQDQTVLACPGLHCGQVRVELYDLRRTKFVSAHNAQLACIALSLDGKLLATASKTGTLIRIHATHDGTKLQELRRGTDHAEIYSIAFSKTESPNWLAVSSDKGTVHIFSLDQRKSASGGWEKGSPEAEAGAKNPVSALSFVSSILPVPYFASQRSFAHFRLPDQSRSVVGFGAEENTVLVVSASGAFFSAVFDIEKGGNCEQASYYKFVELEENGKGQ